MDTNAKNLLIKRGGEMGALIRAKSWNLTSLGPIETWKQILITTLNVLLNSKFPMFLWWGDDLIQFYNDSYRPSLGKDGKHPTALGQRAVDCWQEIWPIIYPLIQNVLATGDPHWSEDQLIPIFRNGRIEDVYWTFSYSAVYNECGKREGVLVTCMETTEKVLNYKALLDTKTALQIANNEAESQRDRLVNFFLDAPSGICILSGPDLVFELVNSSCQQLVPGRILSGKSFFEALPELKDQPIANILYEVYNHDKTFHGHELKIPLTNIDTGHSEDHYFNFTCQPRHNTKKEVDGIMVFVNEVTEQVGARTKLENAEDTLKLSLLAANVGTFDMDIENGLLYWDKRCRALFGISHDNQVSYGEDFVRGLHPDDKERILDVIHKNVFNKTLSNGHYDVEYRTVGAEDKKIRWIRAMGKAYFNIHDEPIRFMGSVLDITEQKEDELRKNDFIGMVSHELKTPLTSLKGYLQILQSPDYSTLAPALLPKIEVQVNKMNNLINSFLNLSRFESGKLTMYRHPFDLDNLINAVIADKRFIAPKHIFKFDGCGEVIVNADKEKIESVIRNLLSNAIKYSAPGTTIHVKCIKHKKHVEVSVTDEGMGIKKEDIQNIFQRYYRVETNATKTISGFGIGLYLSAEIIKRHGGTIGVESFLEKGSIFYFTLPL